jgi:hypothetical protein
MTTLQHTGTAQQPSSLRTALGGLALDVGAPLGTYYLLHGALGVSLWLALALSSIGPAIRSVTGLRAPGGANLLAMLMLTVNIAGIGISFLTGDPRAMIAKDSIVSSVIAFAILASVAAHRPLMSAALKPFLTKGRADRTAAWDRLATSSARFRRLEQVYSAIWGAALLADCAARLTGAYTLPVSTMVWLGTVLTLGSIGVAMVVSGVAAQPMERMIRAAAAVRPEGAC